MPPAKKATKKPKGPTVTVENARTYEDMHLTVSGLEPGVYTMTLDHPDGRRTWSDVEVAEDGEWTAIHPCNYRGDYKLCVWGQPQLIVQGEGRGT